MSRPRSALALVAALLLMVVLSTVAAADTYGITVTQVDLAGYPDVRVVASVTSSGRPAKGIRPDDIVVTEAGRAVSADVRLASEVAPVTAILAIDTSGSMAASLGDAKTAATSFVRALGGADRGAIVAFNAAATVVQDLTGDRAALETAIGGLAANGNTALYDALDRALAVASAGGPATRRAVILLSDGEDTASSAALDDVRVRVGAAAVPVFIVALGERIDRATLDALAAASSGGRVLVAPTPADLASVYDGLAEQLRSDLAISYRTSASGSAPRTLAVELRRGGEVLARTEVQVTPPAAPATMSPASTASPAPVVTARPAPEPTPVTQSADTVGVAILGAAAVGSLVTFVYALDRERQGTERRRRLREFARGPATTTAPATHPSAAAPMRTSLRRAAVPVRPWVPQGMAARTARWLVRAGEPLGIDAYEFITLRLGLAVALALSSFVVAWLGKAEPIMLGLAPVLGALAGYAIPGLVLGWLVRQRKHTMDRALPGSLDMLALSTAAGLTLDGAIAQVASHWDTPFSVELRRYLAEVRVGRGHRDALRALAERVDLPEVSQLTSTILQADVLGVPVANVLREQARELRRKRRQQAEELARIAPVKMLFPMALLIFPALFVVILGPVVPAVLEAFSSP